MALFRRNKQDSVLPEVDKYYEGERRDRPVMAWLLALLSIFVVVLVIVGLFLGGRWAFNKIANNDDDADIPGTTETAEAPSFDGAPDSSNQGQAANGTTQPSTQEQGDQNTAQDGSGNNGSTSTPAQNQPLSTTPAATPQTGDNSLPRTGAGDIIAVFAGTSMLAGGSHYVLQRRKAGKSY